MKPRALHVFVSGLVQGVGFRHATMRQARAMHLGGWARNLPDGRVEAWFEGPEDRLREMRDWCDRGPGLAEVATVQESWEPATESFVSFEIRF